MAEFTNTTQADVLKAIRDRLRDQLELDPSRCYLTRRPEDDPKIPPGGAYYLTVSPGGGSFDEEDQQGGGWHQLQEKNSVTIAFYAPIATDRKDQAEELLLEEERGLLTIKKAILRALRKDFYPTDSDGNRLGVVFAISSTPAEDIGHVSRMMVSFATDFFWDLA